MTKENELLERLVSIRNAGIPVPLDEGILLERELAKLYMPQLQETATENEMFQWGTHFKNIVNQKVEMFLLGKIG